MSISLLGYIGTFTLLNMIPVILLIWNLTLRQGMKSGMALVFGAALSQIIYGFIAVFYPRIDDIVAYSSARGTPENFSIAKIDRMAAYTSGLSAFILVGWGLREFRTKVENRSSIETKFWFISFLSFLVMLLNVNSNITTHFILFPEPYLSKSIMDFLAMSILIVFIGGRIIIVLITGTIKNFLSVEWQNYLRYIGGFILALCSLGFYFNSWILCFKDILGSGPCFVH